MIGPQFAQWAGLFFMMLMPVAIVFDIVRSFARGYTWVGSKFGRGTQNRRQTNPKAFWTDIAAEAGLFGFTLYLVLGYWRLVAN